MHSRIACHYCLNYKKLRCGSLNFSNCTSNGAAERSPNENKQSTQKKKTKKKIVEMVDRRMTCKKKLKTTVRSRKSDMLYCRRCYRFWQMSHMRSNRIELDSLFVAELHALSINIYQWLKLFAYSANLFWQSFNTMAVSVFYASAVCGCKCFHYVAFFFLDMDYLCYSSLLLLLWFRFFCSHIFIYIFGVLISWAWTIVTRLENT